MNGGFFARSIIAESTSSVNVNTPAINPIYMYIQHEIKYKVPLTVETFQLLLFQEIESGDRKSGGIKSFKQDVKYAGNFSGFGV